MDYGDISLGLIIQVRSQSKWILATSGSRLVNKTGPRSISRYSKNPFLRECSANTKAQWIYANFIQVQFLLKPKRMMRFLYQTINIGTNWAPLNLKCSCIFCISSLLLFSTIITKYFPALMKICSQIKLPWMPPFII